MQEPWRPAVGPELHPPPPPPIHFGNPLAVRAAFPLAVAAALLNHLPYVHYACCLWWLGAGFLSVVVYIRRTGLPLSPGDGARLGWITGALTFAIGIIFTALSIAVAGGGSGIREEIRRQWMARIPQDEAARRVVEMMMSPTGLAVILVTSIVLGFLVTISVTVAGGALGAKVMEKE